MTFTRRRLSRPIWTAAALACAAGVVAGVGRPTAAEPPAADEPAPETLLAPVVEETGPREATVHLKDGQRFTGLLVEQTEEHILLRIEGIQTRFPAARVDRVRVLPPVLERYREMRAAIGEDAEQLVKLADWLRAREELDLAFAEVDRALRLNPSSTEAAQLRTLIAKQIELRARARTGAPSTGGAAEDGPASGVTGEAAASRFQQEFPLLTPEQINLIKVFEVDLKRSPRLVVRRETVKKLLERYGRHPLMPVTQEGREAIYRRPPKDILDLMFRVQARDLYGEVQVLDQPDSMRLFRDNVHRTWLLNSCASNACHGGEAAGRFVLHNRRPNADPTVYTNFLILERFRMPDGTPMIDYDAPQRSALLQLAIPREDSLAPHPRVPHGPQGQDVWKPVFRNSDDRRFKQAVEWIESMYLPRPQHPVEYTPPSPPSLASPQELPVPGAPGEPIAR